MPADCGGLAHSRPAVGESGAAAENHGAGDDAPEQSLTACMKELSRYLNGWVAHFRLCTEEATKALRAADAHIRRRLRAIIIRQRKRPRFLFRHLRSRGASIKAAAGAAFSGRGRWFCSNHPGLTRACPPAWFSGKLVSLATRWNELNTNVQVSGQLLLPL